MTTERAAAIRRAWMKMAGHTDAEVDESLRLYPPISEEDEQEDLDGMLEIVELSGEIVQLGRKIGGMGQ